MARNKDIPQGIDADRFGYPVRITHSRYIPRSQRRDLLRPYSDEQLEKVIINLDESKKRWRMIERGGIALSAVAFLGTLATLNAVAIEQSQGALLDPITSEIFEGINHMMPLYHSLGINDMFSAYFLTSTTAISLPLSIGLSGTVIRDERIGRIQEVKVEQARRAATGK
ncbi:MAG TPA: hypothetical protein VLB73_01775 [Patescibacteria group bacterium]|nr:hypothetical protein [Patescibacteria group bacterium]